MNANKGEIRGGYPELSTLLSQFDTAMKLKERGAEKTPVNLLRASVLRQCREKAKQEPGLYTLTVPTGGGKKLSSLAFALEHAILHKKRRVIYAIPYTSIIEQTAEVFRGIFNGRDAVLEHHCNLGSEQDSPKNRLASENWDALLIATTNVSRYHRFPGQDTEGFECGDGSRDRHICLRKFSLLLRHRCRYYRCRGRQRPRVLTTPRRALSDFLNLTREHTQPRRESTISPTQQHPAYTRRKRASQP